MHDRVRVDLAYESLNALLVVQLARPMKQFCNLFLYAVELSPFVDIFRGSLAESESPMNWIFWELCKS